MTELLQKAITELSKLPEQQQDEYANWILSKLASELDEEAWEERVVSEALGDAWRPDGSIDFDKLHATGTILTLDELALGLADRTLKD